ncbi:hypothetical protein PIROE2DRAFT_16984 [Piromyces sp. E2]|nr:hypothetical protein PIROE2DRAFT_16984 [Piromyces sp. E2]|eukprot:OUM57885.1 hypothetical protein PIROE2DRAFT_16984 [Piromyces sp. E2]
MNCLNTFFCLLAISCINIFVAARNINYGYKPSEGSSYLDFPQFEEGFTEKNAMYVLYYEKYSSRFPILLPAYACRFNMKDAVVDCRLEDYRDEQTIKNIFGGAAQLVIHVDVQNPKKCDTFEKQLDEVVLYDENDSPYQIVGTTYEEVKAHKFEFKLNDGCEFTATFDKISLERL